MNLNWEDWWIVGICCIIVLCLIVFSIHILARHLSMNVKKVVIVFDLDETLGSFSQLSPAHSALERYYGRPLSGLEFKYLIDMNKDVLRPFILDVLALAIRERVKGNCDAIMLYTNNSGGRKWPHLIANYFDMKLNTKVFDQIICAFKVNGIRLEPNRTTHDKTFEDFIRCTRLPENTEICFVDDLNHTGMNRENIFYVNIKPYHNRKQVSTRLLNYFNGDERRTADAISAFRSTYGEIPDMGQEKTKEEYEVDAVIGKYAYQRITDFFNKMSRKKRRKSNSTRKKLKRDGRFTRGRI